MKLIKYFVTAITMAVVLAGCATKIERNGNNNPTPTPDPKPDDPQTEFVLRENKSWTVEYGGRKTDEEKGVYEEIVVNSVPAGQLYLVSVINRANYDSYDGDLEAFLKNEYKYNSDYVYTGSPQTMEFGRFLHGTWYAFVIGLDSQKKLTGEYAYSKFNVDEEDPTPEYLSWVGSWKVSQGGYTYNITVSQAEANMIYRVDGWEVISGDPDWNQMNYEDDYLETFYEPTDGNMYFTSQYITSYQDEDLGGETVEEYFFGQIDYDGIHEKMGLYIIPEEGMDLAYARHNGEDNASVNPCRVKVDVGKDKDYETQFYCMQYVYKAGQDYLLYNQQVPALPMNMVRTQDSGKLSLRTRNAVKRSALSSEDTPRRGRLYQPHAESNSRSVKALAN